MQHAEHQTVPDISSSVTSQLTRVLVLASDSAAAMIYNKRAAAYSAQGNTPKALQDYDQAVSLDPSAPGARIKR